MQHAREVPQPACVVVEDHQLFFPEQRISFGQARAVRDYLASTVEVPSKHVHCLTIDTCQITDESLALILEGVRMQTPANRRRLYLKKLVVSNTRLGPISMIQVASIVGSLEDLTLCNIQPQLGRDTIHQLLVAILDHGRRIQKLKLSKMNLNDHATVQLLIDIMNKQRQVMVKLDLSWASLSC